MCILTQPKNMDIELDLTVWPDCSASLNALLFFSFHRVQNKHKRVEKEANFNFSFWEGALKAGMLNQLYLLFWKS